MKITLYTIIFCLSLFSCKKTNETPKNGEIHISQRVQLKSDNSDWVLTSGKYENQFSKSELPLKNVVVLNASLIGYLNELGLQDKIIGVSSPEYIYSRKIHQLMEEGKIQNVGNEQKYNVEKIISLKPDAIITNHIASFENTYDLLRKNGMKIIFLDEYLEEKPLDKTAYLKIFGKLFGVEKKADSLYTAIEKQYNDLKNKAQKAQEKPTLIANEMYGNQWFVPGGDSFNSQYFKDANTNYPWISNTDKNSIPLSFEEVYAKSKNAKYWVNVSDYKNKEQLLAFNPSYVLLNPYKNGKIYSVGNRTKGKTNDFFESGVVRADKVLKDYINIFHPGLLQDSTLFYMKELKD